MRYLPPIDAASAKASTGGQNRRAGFRRSAALLFAAWVAFPPLAHGFSGYDGAWADQYPASNSLANSDCALCHLDRVNASTAQGTFNKYGLAIRNAAGADIAARILAVQSANSDGDPAGRSNLDEINANTQPGWTEGANNVVYASDATVSATGVTAPGNIAGLLDIHYTVGGNVSGLSGSVTLKNNGGNNLATGNGSFTFSTALSSGSAYAVTVASQPAGQHCTVSNGSGTVGSANVTNVSVSCVPAYTVGGNVSGLTGTVTLQDNGGDDLQVNANGGFTFATALLGGSNYAVTVSQQPLTQTCTITNDSGTIASANVTNVTVTCIVNTYSVGGNLTGLVGSVTLRNNGGDDLVLTANGGYTFGTELATGGTYAVTVSSQPAGQTCTVTNGTGNIAAADIANVGVNCVNAVRSFTGTLPSGATGTLSFTTTDPGCSFVGTPQFLSAAGVNPPPPAGVTPIDGLVQFTITGCLVGATVQLSMDYGTTLPAGAAYWKVGNPWFPLSVVVHGGIVQFSLTDGGPGDSDGAANGQIVDPSGAVLDARSARSTNAVPAITGWALAALSVLLVLAALVRRRRRDG